MSRMRKRRGISLGTIVMLIVTICVGCSLGYVLPQLQGSQPYVLDTGKVLEALSLTGLPELSLNDIPIEFLQQSEVASAVTEPPAAVYPIITEAPEATVTVAPVITATAVPTSIPTVAPTEIPKVERSFTVTFTGSIMLEDGVRKGAWIDEADKYDFSGMLSYVAPEMKQADLCVVPLENIIDDEKEFSDNITTSKMVSMLVDAGADAVALAYPKAANEGVDGVLSTISAVRARGLTLLGTNTDAESAVQPSIMTLGGVNVTVLQYTDSLSSSGEKKLTNSAAVWAVSVADTSRIASDIAQARQMGAEVVIVCVNWGEDDSSTPSKSQKTLAQAIADAGADAIIGTGTKAVQTAEWIASAVTGRKTFCAYSLGALMNEGRSDKNVASYILQMTFRVDVNDQVEISQLNCVPTYIWRYKEDGKYRYFAVPSAKEAPDTMSESQVEVMERALNNVRKLLADSPLAIP